MGITAGINADVWVTVNPTIALSAPEACTDSGDHIHYTSSVHFAWDKRATFTVQNCPTAAPVTTQNTAAITVGSVVVTPVTGTLMSNIVVGSKLSIAAGGGTAEVVTVTAITGTTFTATFAFTHTANTAITTVWTTVTDYTVQWAIGQITFNAARVVGTNNYTQISAGSYFTITQLDGCNKWTLSLKSGLIKTTTFQATGGWETNTGTVKSWIGTVEAWRTDDRLMQEVAAGNLVIVQLFFNKTGNQRWQGYATITGVDAAADVMAVNTQKITFETVNDLFYMLS